MTNGDDETRPTEALSDGGGGAAGVTAPTRPSDGRWRRIAIALGALAAILVIVVVVLLLADSGGGGGDEVNAAARNSTTTTTSSTSTSSTTLASSTSTPATSGGTTATTTAPTNSTGGTTATTGAAGPVITSYTASSTSIACPAPDVSTTLPPTSITLTWTTQNATGVDLSVDGPGVYGSYPANGNTQITVPCNGATHTYQLTAKGAGGQTATKTISVQTHT